MCPEAWKQIYCDIWEVAGQPKKKKAKVEKLKDVNKK